MRLTKTLSMAAVSLLAGAVAAAPSDGERLSPSEMVAGGSEALVAMRSVLSAVNKLVDDARSERDALRLNCVNERKNQIAGLVRVAELSLEEMRDALKESQSDAADHELDKIRTARSKVENYKVEAEQCIGSLAFYDAYDKVERQLTVPSDLPGADVVSPEAMPPPVFRPPPASPSTPR
jgi:hypothetical protein